MESVKSVEGKNGFPENFLEHIEHLTQIVSTLLDDFEKERVKREAQEKLVLSEVRKLQNSIAVLTEGMSQATHERSRLKTDMEFIKNIIVKLEESQRKKGENKPVSEGEPKKQATGPQEKASAPEKSGQKIAEPPVKMSEYLRSKQSIFDTRVLNAFITAAKGVTKALLQCEPKYIKANPLPPGTNLVYHHVARMKLTKGQGSGYMGIAFKLQHINARVANIFGIRVNEVTGAMINDLTKEFCNQTFGQAKSELVKVGIEYTISNPELGTGDRLEMEKKWGNPFLALILELDNKEFYILFW